MVKLDKSISMNSDLLDPKEVMIGRLKSKIEAFKKYDEERKAYYKDALIRLGELESLVDESDPERKLRDKIKNQKKAIQSLQAILATKNIDFPEDMDLTIAKGKITELKLKVNNLTSQLNKHKRTISDLVNKLIKYEIYQSKILNNEID